MQVKIIGWKPGAQKVSCTKLLQESAGMRLADAHATTVAATEGRQPIVAVHSEDVAYELVDALDNLGFMAQLINVGTSVPREEAIRIASVHLARSNSVIPTTGLYPISLVKTEVGAGSSHIESNV